MVFDAASASSQTSRSGELDAEIQLITAGPGTLTISPAEFGDSANCEVDAQEYVGDSNCVNRYETGTTVKITAEPKPGHSFIGWSDFKCARTSTTCAMTLAPGPRYVTARFSPVTLKYLIGTYPTGEGRPFGSITVKPKPIRACTYDYEKPCEYASGTVVTLRRQHAAAGYFWIGACEGNRGGRLDAAVCTIRLQSSELVGVGYKNPGDIPPVKGAGIAIRLAGKGSGKVTGGVINGSKRLVCEGKDCSMTELERTDYVRLVPVASRGSHFDRWNDSRQRIRVIGLAGKTRLWVKFDKG